MAEGPVGHGWLELEVPVEELAPNRDAVLLREVATLIEVRAELELKTVVECRPSRTRANSCQ